MHEMSLVRPVVDIVLKSCEGKNVGAVRTVNLTIGETHDVVNELVPGLFRYLARGTVAENAEVLIRTIPLTVQCDGCGAIFRIDVHDQATWRCPQCGARQNYHLYSGQEFRIDSIEVEWGDEVQAERRQVNEAKRTAAVEAGAA